MTRSFHVFFDLLLNKRLSKQWRGWWFETLSRPLWRYRNEGQQCEKLFLAITSSWWIHNVCIILLTQHIIYYRANDNIVESSLYNAINNNDNLVKMHSTTFFWTQCEGSICDHNVSSILSSIIDMRYEKSFYTAWHGFQKPGNHCTQSPYTDNCHDHCHAGWDCHNDNPGAVLDGKVGIMTNYLDSVVSHKNTRINWAAARWRNSEIRDNGYDRVTGYICTLKSAIIR